LLSSVTDEPVADVLESDMLVIFKY
jgi:hypothetical protein